MGSNNNMNLIDCMKCIYYNLISNFYICLNYIIPLYQEEIICLNYKVIESMNEGIVFEHNSRKRRRFNMFVDSIVQKNNEFIEKIRTQEDEDNDIKNYEKVLNENDSQEESQEESQDDSCDDSCDESCNGPRDGDNEDFSTESETTIIETDKKNV